MCPNCRSGFTLVELSIVLVIIGLVVGGIFLGQDILAAAAMRAQLAQLDKYNSAVHSFQNKYLGLPGDLKLSYANSFGFVTTSCDGSQGKRDGNGVIEGAAFPYPNNEDQFLGETGMFWEDLSQAGFIDGAFPGNSATARACNTDTTLITLTTGTYYVGDFIPAAKIGLGNFIYVYSGNGASSANVLNPPGYSSNNDNWFGISAVTGTGVNGWSMNSNESIPVYYAYNIDTKIDDGIATTGNVIAYYITANSITPAYTLAAPSSATCFDYTSSNYSISINSGKGPNCSLSIKLQ